MKIKGLTERQLKKRLNYLEKTRPASRWIKYIKYHLRRIGFKNYDSDTAAIYPRPKISERNRPE